MDKHVQCMIAEKIGEGLIGYAIGTALTKTILSKCNTTEKVFVTLGGTVLAWTAGRAFAKTFFKFCDNQFDTEFGREIEEVL